MTCKIPMVHVLAILVVVGSKSDQRSLRSPFKHVHAATTQWVVVGY